MVLYEQKSFYYLNLCINQKILECLFKNAYLQINIILIKDIRINHIQ